MTTDQLWAEFQNRYQIQVKAEPVIYTIDEMIDYWTIRYNHTQNPKDKRVLNYWQSKA